MWVLQLSSPLDFFVQKIDTCRLREHYTAPAVIKVAAQMLALQDKEENNDFYMSCAS